MFREQFRAQAVGREPVSPLVPLHVPLLAEVSASACMVPIRANTPAAPANVTAAARAAARLCGPRRLHLVRCWS
ncbi:hypothetical protein BM536_009515 [Streptomyces phaeoluteigriseus]|uniref:Uncharacterized protein n=1 Tax=Streptomyces phaeoluteigriseus TaxID=114686 RepID=A0A1V6MVH1_9ACTN|nr:hypothetical protein [Streptomyces phaeoluteigriseus]OQD56461.1 hypothetical protein BM536_009515 [Streptomyces phaeoluteigriseus]